jgi:glycosyltransferase involved in cell wall biosynthesis
MVGAFAPYKRVDLAIEAFNRLKLPLMIVGGGQDEKRLRKIAGPTIEFFGALSNAAIADFYSKCKAFVFPGKEDFGITPLEANASGAPVIAYRAGGAAETMTEKTALFFEEQSVDALADAVEKLESGRISLAEEDCRARAQVFTKDRFQREFTEFVRRGWKSAGRDLSQLDQTVQKGWSDAAKSTLGRDPLKPRSSPSETFA